MLSGGFCEKHCSYPSELFSRSPQSLGLEKYPKVPMSFTSNVALLPGLSLINQELGNWFPSFQALPIPFRGWVGWLTPVKEEIKMEKYNGWTNRSTWAVHLWITNEWDYYSLARRDKFSGSDLKIWWTGICKRMPNIKEDCDPLEQVNWEEVSEALKDD